MTVTRYRKTAKYRVFSEGQNLNDRSMKINMLLVWLVKVADIHWKEIKYAENVVFPIMRLAHSRKKKRKCTSY